MSKKRIKENMKISSGVCYQMRKGNKGVGRKILEIEEELGLSCETETVRYCVQKVWKDLFQK